MTWILASVILVVAAPWVFWPLIRHREETPGPAPGLNASEAESDLEEIEVDLAAGRLSAAAADRLRERLR